MKVLLEAVLGSLIGGGIAVVLIIGISEIIRRRS